jgi:hypothetical protein
MRPLDDGASTQRRRRSGFPSPRWIARRPDGDSQLALGAAKEKRKGKLKIVGARVCDGRRVQFCSPGIHAQPPILGWMAGTNLADGATQEGPHSGKWPWADP